MPEVIVEGMQEATAPVRWLDCIRLELASGVKLSRRSNTWLLETGASSISFMLPPGDTAATLSELQEGSVQLGAVAPLFARQKGALSLGEQLGRLWRAGVLVASLYNEGKKLATLYHRGGVPLVPAEVNRSAELVVSEDACIRYEDESLLMESAATASSVRIFSEEFLLFPVPTGRPVRCDQWARAAMVPEGLIVALASWLMSIGLLSEADENGASVRRRSGWSFADRMMHARSRRGRHIGGYGGTYRFIGQLPEPPAIREASEMSCIRLPCPSLSEIAARDLPFTEVLERRRSKRDHGPEALSLGRLSEFLYRTCRVTRQATMDGHEFAFRPYPSAGGCHELEVYLMANRCAGLAAGLYRYDGSQHALIEVAEPGPDTRELIEDARQSAMMQGEPHVVFHIAARFMRVNWKYESLAYSLTLKNAGVLFQTMYLVATAMGLAGCAVGGGPSDTFCRVAKTDFWQESTVGEFLLGEPAPN